MLKRDGLGTALTLILSLALLPACMAQGWQPCQAAKPLHLAEPTPPPERWAAEFEDLASIAGGEDKDLVANGRTGLGFSPGEYFRHVAINDALDLGAASGGFAFWLYNNGYYGASQSGGFLLETDNVAGFNIQLSIGALPELKGDLRLLVQDTAGRLSAVETSILNWFPGEWRHIAGTWGDGFLRLYLDGRLMAESGAATPLRADPADPLPSRLFLLSSKRNASPARGLWTMDRLRTYDTSLTPQDIVQLYLSEADRSGPLLKAGRLAVKLLGPLDGYSLEAIQDSRTQRAVTVEAPPGRWWRLHFRSADEPNSPFTADSTQMSATCQQSTDGQIELQWTFRLPAKDLSGAGSSVGKVTLGLTPKTDEAEARLEVTHDPSDPWALHLAALRVGGLAPIDAAAPESSQLIVPGSAIGFAVEKPTGSLLYGLSGGNLGWHRPLGEGINRYPSSAMSMQWTSLLDPERETGVYLAAHDPSGQLKSFFYDNSIGDPYSSAQSLRGDLLARHPDHGVDLELVVYGASVDTPGNGYAQGWPMVLRLQDGGWWDHAQRYRQFALQQSWTQRGPLRTRTDQPEWFTDLGLIHFSTRYSDTVGLLENAMQDLAAQEGFAAEGHILWHFTSWHDEGQAGPGNQANDLPFASIGADFEILTKAAEDKQTPAAIYLLPASWDIARDGGALGTYNRDDWNRLEGWTHAVRGLGQTAKEVVGPAGPDADGTQAEIQLVRMDPSSLLWRDLNLELVDKVSPQRVEALYLDEVADANPRICHAGDHGHPPGGGIHRTEAYRTLMDEMRETASLQRDPLGLRRMAFYSEGFTEAYMDQLDGYLIWKFDTNSPRPLPLAQAVYHDFAVFLGRSSNITALEQSNLPQDVLDDNRQVATARSGQMFLWGGVPGFLFGNLHGSAQPVTKLREYLLRLARLRRVGKSYLVYGQMLPPLEVSIAAQPPSVPPDVDAHVSELPVAAQQVPNLDTPGVDQIPRLAASLWAGISPSFKPGLGLAMGSLEIDHGALCDPCWSVVTLPRTLLQRHLLSTRYEVYRLGLDGQRSLVARTNGPSPTLSFLVRLGPSETVLLEIEPL